MEEAVRWRVCLRGWCSNRGLTIHRGPGEPDTERLDVGHLSVGTLMQSYLKEIQVSSQLRRIVSVVSTMGRVCGRNLFSQVPSDILAARLVREACPGALYTLWLEW